MRHVLERSRDTLGRGDVRSHLAARGAKVGDRAFGIELMFVQDGRRHNDGYYQLSDWGPFDSQWVLERKGDIATSLGFSA